MPRKALVHYRDETRPLECPFGVVQRVVTAGEGGVANVHVVEVTKGTRHYHEGYDEVYYVLSGTGRIVIETQEYRLRPGATVVVPRGASHELEADRGDTLEFIIFGTPAMPIDDDRAQPRR